MTRSEPQSKRILFGYELVEHRTALLDQHTLTQEQVDEFFDAPEEQVPLGAAPAGNSGAVNLPPDSTEAPQDQQETSVPNSTTQNPEAADAQSPDSNPPVEIETPPVEVRAPLTDDVPAAEPVRLYAESFEVMGESLRDKAVQKVEELGDRLEELCGTTPQELDASRNFVQDLKGRHAGWRLIVDVSVKLRRSPE